MRPRLISAKLGTRQRGDITRRRERENRFLSTLLLVDDDLGTRTVMARGLASQGFAVVTAADGREAVGLLDKAHVDVLVTDLHMPIMDGFELLAHVKKHASNLPVVVLSASTGEITDELDPFGALHVLAKPVSAKTLAGEARAALAELGSGHVTGITLPNFLQLLQWERKTCAVKVTSGKREGRLHFLSGELVNAYVAARKLEGEAAAYDIFSWDEVDLVLERSYHNKKRVIRTPLQQLLMDALRLKDEALRDEGTGEAAGEEAGDETAFLTEEEAEIWFRKSKADPAGVSPAPPEARPEFGDEEIDIQAQFPEATVEPSAEVVATGDSVQRENIMANVKRTLESLLSDIDGAMAAAIVDYKSGMALGTVGTGLDLEVAAAGNTEVVRAKMKTMSNLGLKGAIEDILITLDKQYHIIRPVPDQTLFTYLVLNREQANLAMARYQLASISKSVAV